MLVHVTDRFFLVHWEGEESHSIVHGKDFDRNAAVVKPGEKVMVKVAVGARCKLEWYSATVIGSGNWSIHVEEADILMFTLSH